MNSKAEIAQQYFISGFNCAQAVFLAFAEDYGLDFASAAKVAGGLGGGLQVGSACGALSGAALAIGLIYGQKDAADGATKADCYAKTKEFAAAFSGAQGGIDCRDLLAQNVVGDTDIEKAESRKAYCRGLVYESARLLAEKLESWK